MNYSHSSIALDNPVEQCCSHMCQRMRSLCCSVSNTCTTPHPCHLSLPKHVGRGRHLLENGCMYMSCTLSLQCALFCPPSLHTSIYFMFISATSKKYSTKYIYTCVCVYIYRYIHTQTHTTREINVLIACRQSKFKLRYDDFEFSYISYLWLLSRLSSFTLSPMGSLVFNLRMFSCLTATRIKIPHAMLWFL